MWHWFLCLRSLFYYAVANPTDYLVLFLFMRILMTFIYLFICVCFFRLKHQWAPISLQVEKLLPQRGQNSPAEYRHRYVNLYLYLIFMFIFSYLRLNSIFNCITTVSSTNSHHWLSLTPAIKCMQK